MSHRVAPQAEAELDGIWYYVEQASGSLELADRLIDSITQRFLMLSQVADVMRSCSRDIEALLG